METQGKKKQNKGGSVIRFEPQNLQLVNSDPTFIVSFEQDGCMRFCENIQGYNVQLRKEFSLNFNGVQKNILITKGLKCFKINLFLEKAMHRTCIAISRYASVVGYILCRNGFLTVISAVWVFRKI
jgi:hypothetical protein